jgi:phospholipid/cholesterol/gamma-HCH transport system substrate-binding protein
MNLDKLPFVNSTNTYYADFEDAAGLKSGDDVRVEGINVGSVDSVRVQGGHVHVGFTVQSDLRLGSQSSATIEIATVLGNEFLQVESSGSGTLHEGATIPIGRTTVPYSLLGALDAFGNFAQGTNLPKLRQSLKTLAQTISGISPKDAQAALDGLASVSRTLAGKQAEVSQVLTTANAIVSTLNHNSGALVGLLSQGEEFLRLVKQRQHVIAQLLRDTARLGTQLDQLIRRNGLPLHSALANLETVTHVLAQQKAQLQQAVINLGQFGINITNATGAGPWLDLLTPVTLIPDNQIKACGTNPAGDSHPCGK